MWWFRAVPIKNPEGPNYLWKIQSEKGDVSVVNEAILRDLVTPIIRIRNETMLERCTNHECVSELKTLIAKIESSGLEIEEFKDEIVYLFEKLLKKAKANRRENESLIGVGVTILAMVTFVLASFYHKMITPAATGLDLLVDAEWLFHNQRIKRHQKRHARRPTCCMG